MLALVAILAACGGHVYHVVERGETLYSIGWATGQDYRDIARWNHIAPPYHLDVGQRLRVAPPATVTSYAQVDAEADDDQPQVSVPAAQVKRPAAAPVIEAGEAPAQAAEPAEQAPRGTARLVAAVKEKLFNQQPVWHWPTREHRILHTFSSKDPSRQGVDIAGEQGNPVYAAATGKVVYAGSGLVRYGQLIIIKHSEKYLSAYAHNHKLHVKEGEVVKVGQRIADMGSTGTTRNKLHFEIRRDGKPVDPLRYLPK